MNRTRINDTLWVYSYIKNTTVRGYSIVYKVSVLVLNFIEIFFKSFTDKQLVAAYSRLTEGWSDESKIELIENLSKSLKKEKNKDKLFFKTFGAFASEKSPCEIIKEIRSGRKFRKKKSVFNEISA